METPTAICAFDAVGNVSVLTIPTAVSSKHVRRRRDMCISLFGPRSSVVETAFVVRRRFEAPTVSNPSHRKSFPVTRKSREFSRLGIVTVGFFAGTGCVPNAQVTSRDWRGSLWPLSRTRLPRRMEQDHSKYLVHLLHVPRQTRPPLSSDHCPLAGVAADRQTRAFAFAGATF